MVSIFGNITVKSFLNLGVFTIPSRIAHVDTQMSGMVR